MIRITTTNMDRSRRARAGGVVIAFVTQLLTIAPGATALEGSIGQRQRGAPGSTSQATGTSPQLHRPNIIFILTDDQRWDEVDFMPFTAEHLKNKGVVYTNAFVTNPVCCPSRASLLSGGFYSHNTGVLTNSKPNGGVWKFKDDDTLATRLHENGYATALIGKYLNDYVKFARDVRPNVPPGWTRWVGSDNNSDWYKWSVCEASSRGERGEADLKIVEEYSTNYLRDRCLEFLEQHAGREQPVFLMFCPLAPHLPAMPSRLDGDDQRYAGLLTGGNWVYRGRGWGENQVGNVEAKPYFIRNYDDRWWDADPSFYDKMHFKRGHQRPDDLVAHRVQSLLAVDRAVEAIFKMVQAKGIADQTVFIFASDNGFLLGEHRIYDKRLPYEESIRVPLMIWYPGVEHRFCDDFVTVDLDVPNTVLDYAETPQFQRTDGQSLRKSVEQAVEIGRDRLLFEFYMKTEGAFIPTWYAVRDKQWKFIEYGTAERELYDLASDPFELRSVAGEQESVERMRADRETLASFQGLSIVMPLADFPRQLPSLPRATVGQDYSFRLTAMGGKPPYTWTVNSDSIGADLHLDASTGVISGKPTSAGMISFEVLVKDGSTSPVHGGPQQFLQPFSITVIP